MASPAAVGRPSPSVEPLARRAAIMIVVGLATVVARMHELLPALQVVRPVFLVVGVLVLTTAVMNQRANRPVFLLGDPSLLVLYLYWAWMALTIPTSIFRGNSLQIVRDQVLPILFATVIAAQPAVFSQLRVITRGFGAVCAVYGVLIMAFGQPMIDNDGLRYSLTASLDPNDAAAVLVIGAPMVLAEARRRGKFTWRLLNWAMLAAICLGVYRTGSRGGAIALIVGLALVILSGRGMRVLVTACALLFSGVLIREFAPVELGRFATIGNIGDDYNMSAYGGRVQIWKRGVQYFIQNPLLGVGVGGFQVREGQQMEADGVPGKWSAPHSAYVQSFVELGFFGGALFVTVLVVTIRRMAPVFRVESRQTGMTHPEYLSAMVAFAVSAIFLSHAYFWGFYALVGIGALVSRTLVVATAGRVHRR